MNEFKTAQRGYDMASDEPTYRELVAENQLLREEIGRMRDELAEIEKMIEVYDGKNDS